MAVLVVAWPRWVSVVNPSSQETLNSLFLRCGIIRKENYIPYYDNPY